MDDAGVSSKTDRVRVLNWLEARSGPKGAKRTDVSKTRQTLEILDKYGTVARARRRDRGARARDVGD